MQDIIDNMLGLLLSLGLTPADLLRRQMELGESAQPEAVPYKDENKRINKITLDSENLPEDLRPAIETAAAARGLAVPAERIWRDFWHYNAEIKHRVAVPLRWLSGFVKKWEDRMPDPETRPVDGRKRPARAKGAEKAPTAALPALCGPARGFAELAAVVPYHDCADRARELSLRIGEPAFAARLEDAKRRSGFADLRARALVLGEAMRAGEFSRTWAARAA